MFLLRKKSFVYFILLTLVLVGLFSMSGLQRESFPEITAPFVVVNTALPGASPLDVEELVTNPIERQLKRALSNTKAIDSNSTQNLSSIFIEFDTHIDITEAINDVRTEIEIVKPDLPTDATDPSVSQYSFSDEPIYIVSLSSRLAYTELIELVEIVEEKLLGITGVSAVEVTGLPKREINVVLDPNTLESLGISPLQVVNAISQGSRDVPLGSIQVNDVNYGVSFKSAVHSADELGKIVIKHTENNSILLQDLGYIEDGLQTYNSFSRLSNSGSAMQQAVTFAIKKQVGTDVTKITDSSEKIISQVTQEIDDPSIEFVTLLNMGDIIQSDLSELSFSGLQTVILVFLVMFIGLGFRESLLSALSVPMSFLLAFIGFAIFDVTLNFVSLFALIIVIGILVDSAVVITEGISQYIDQGLTPSAAATATLQNYFSPVTAGTATTIAVFIPLLFLSGITGQFIASIPSTIIIVLIASLIVAFTFVPVIAAKLLRPSSKGIKSQRNKYFNKISSKYRTLLKKFLDTKKYGRRILYSIIGLFFVAIGLVVSGQIPGEFFPADHFDQFNITVTMPAGNTIENTSDSLTDIEDIVLNHSEVKSFVANIRAESATLIVNIKDERKGDLVVNDLRQILKERSSLETVFSPPSSGPSGETPFAVKFIGSNLEDLRNAARLAEKTLNETKGAVDIRTGIDGSTLGLDLHIDRNSAAAAGIEPQTIALNMRTAIQGLEATTIRSGGKSESVDVIVKVALDGSAISHEKTNQINFDQLLETKIITPNFGAVPLRTLVKESLVTSLPNIPHEDQERVISVTSFLEPGTVVAVLNKNFLENFDESLLPESVTMSFGGDTEASAEAGTELALALLVGILLVIVILVYQFNSIRNTIFVISVVPFGLIGVLFGLWIFGQTLSFTAMLGFVALVGIVVNNSIILIDVITNNIKKGDSKYDAVLEGATSRLRPILLTTATTIFGMTPLLLSSPVWRPLALVVMVGLAFAVVLTLVLVPLLFYWWGRSK